MFRDRADAGMRWSWRSSVATGSGGVCEEYIAGRARAQRLMRLDSDRAGFGERLAQGLVSFDGMRALTVVARAEDGRGLEQDEEPSHQVAGERRRDGERDVHRDRLSCTAQEGPCSRASPTTASAGIRSWLTSVPGSRRRTSSKAWRPGAGLRRCR